jgi:hypothetical protein
MASFIPKRINFKHAFISSPLSKMNVTDLTPSDKLLLARSRIWGTGIMGKQPTGSRYLRSRLMGPSKQAYFDYDDFRNYLPFHPLKDTFHDEIQADREARINRRGKTAVVLPKRSYKEVPRWKRIAYLVQEERRRIVLAGEDKKKK